MAFHIDKVEARYFVTVHKDGIEITLPIYKLLEWNDDPILGTLLMMMGETEEYLQHIWANPSEWARDTIETFKIPPSKHILKNTSEWSRNILTDPQRNQDIPIINANSILIFYRNPAEWVKEYTTIGDLFLCSRYIKDIIWDHLNFNPSNWARDLFNVHPEYINWDLLCFNQSKWAHRLHRNNLDKVNWDYILYSHAPWAMGLIKENMERLDDGYDLSEFFEKGMHKLEYDMFMKGEVFMFPIERL